PKPRLATGPPAHIFEPAAKAPLKLLCNFIEKFCKKSTLSTQSINLTRPESRIVHNLFVKKLFYALFCATKIVIHPVINYMSFTFCLKCLES
ncbi:MAG: hypothetical protein ACK56F_08180, partial [bacterium]